MKTRLILLAAGNSRRFGSNKLLYSINEKPMFLYGLEVMKELLLKDFDRELYVVTRFEPVMEAVEELKADPFLHNRTHVINSPNSTLGISYSIKAGLLEGEMQPDYYMFMVADQPFIKTETVERLIKETLSQEKIAGCVTWDGVSGNPVIFSKQLKNELLELQEDQGGKVVLKKYMNQICKISASCEEELIDKDTKEEI
ncbi:nucleotidyltransferase family protein [Lachnoclostridium sp.]|uniref:nucleotidyltransferase family protein n=1 Tax=Lachnoclostridium sp. TaxID=2028282 RepID=UPI00289C12E9|nr:nucleotidyltransferase family protein [Lachnoclostridium sp.]